MDIKIIVALISVSGIALGSVIRGVGYFYQVRAERLKTTKETLYYLLEFRAHLKASSFSPSDLSAAYFSLCRDFFKKKHIVEGDVPKQLDLVLNQMFASIIEKVTPNISCEFLAAYETSLKALANDNPVLAYKLRGKEAYSGMFDMVDEYFKHIKAIDEFKSDDSIHELMNRQIGQVSDWGFNEQLEQTDLDITLVAKRCDLRTRWEVRQILKNKNKPTHNLQDFGIEELLELLLNDFLSNHPLTSQDS
ncbi:hypothetical protein [Vibrio lentus]|uniref:Uncharacterized protein n=1 Tax=Vibrio lentus TaxID=136468 RepID=A0A855IUQ4_9VIBR|nr:hypothetical protein [Vibrio lentus]PMM61307.1 hypothetical protein BCT50_21030 [Vibrio lentus]